MSNDSNEDLLCAWEIKEKLAIYALTCENTCEYICLVCVLGKMASEEAELPTNTDGGS